VIDPNTDMSENEHFRETNALHDQPSMQRSVDNRLASLLLESLRVREEMEDLGELPHSARALLLDGVRERATDIHLDPVSQGLQVRMRIDGVMRDAAVLIPRDGHRLTNQLKSLAGMDPVAQFNADEARFTLEHDAKDVDVRFAIVPCLHGDKLTLRILDPRQLGYDIHELGLSEWNLSHIQHWFVSLGGMFLVAGPVGSGKTTTLYSLLHALKLQSRSVSTLEDPVEYGVDGINQVQVDEEHGLTFPVGIKALSRHDPDVILVGELRDSATAQAAYGAAALGRTLLATLHARDAAGVVTSLRYFGLSDRDIATTLSVVVAQRLVRKLCPNCRRTSSPTEEEERWFERIGFPVPESTWSPGQCDGCGGSGYSGRTGVFEVWRLEEEEYHLLLDGATERAIRHSLASRSHRHFLADAMEKARVGVTTLAEVQRLHLAGPALSPSVDSLRASIK